MGTEHFFFLLGFCFLLVHEMDAIRCKEWRIFPVTSKMGDEAGYLAFTALHIPLYAGLLWGPFSGGMNGGLIFVLDVFFIVHVLLHVMLISGAGMFGAADLLSRTVGVTRA